MWYSDSFAPIGNSDRGFFYFSRKQILNNSEFYDKIISAYNFKKSWYKLYKTDIQFYRKKEDV
ncbi:hypothetical protein CN425_12490 [Bacillus cereus]|uniref:Uncharacterized protein n=1 Tax=Bacillus cereus TaxID=1396 RepID=A0A2A8PY84_BACCE|nr:hypothetical protein CON38_14885 [Bacillus cereus]PEW02263.1 hypothetical protein CN425_12490 [Bacillus cereus]PFI23489.1 hypothetical protein COI75_10645 [Bacillus cereus]